MVPGRLALQDACQLVGMVAASAISLPTFINDIASEYRLQGKCWYKACLLACQHGCFKTSQHGCLGIRQVNKFDRVYKPLKSFRNTHILLFSHYKLYTLKHSN
jgi:hypothetical protein